MVATIRILAVSLCVSLTACQTTHSSYQSYQYGDSTYTSQSPLYPDSYESVQYGQYLEEKTALPPEKFNRYEAPVPAKDMDKHWILGQNPQAYTIELDQSERASQVASALSNAPKNERMAEIKYQKNGKTYYQGIYGSFPSAEAAQQALSRLPDNVKQNAQVKSWANVQVDAN